jgi:hypothetical protein
MSKDFFPSRPKSRPAIYAYEDTNPQYAGLLKVGYTTVDVQSRVAQQYPTKKPGNTLQRLMDNQTAMDALMSLTCYHSCPVKIGIASACEVQY